MLTNNLALLSLALCPYLGPKKIANLEKRFSCLQDVFLADSKQLNQAGLSLDISLNFIGWRKEFSLTKILNNLNQENISYISWNDDTYPNSLKEISSPPPIIFYQGNVALLNNSQPKLAIVGSRKNTPYAKKIITDFMPNLIEHKIIIISGLALGVDTLAHRQVLIDKGETIAVLGSGLNANNIYPRINKPLAQKIINNGGLIISEFPPDSPALKTNFPRRNRLISGLSEAVLIIEAAKKSGSLITAGFALEQNREVMAIPGNIFSPSSEGTNNLIKSGAATISSVEDILNIFKIETNINKLDQKKTRFIKYQPTDETEKIIYEAILMADTIKETLSVDEIVKKTKLDTATINSKLSILEIKKVIINCNGYFELSL